MTKAYILTEDEYTVLTTAQNEPSMLLQSTIDNYKHKLSEANTKIKELEAQLLTYELGNAKRVEVTKPSKLEAVVKQYNDAVRKGVGIIKTSDRACKWFNEFTEFDDMSPPEFRKYLKLSVRKGLIIKNEDNKYTIITKGV